MAYSLDFETYRMINRVALFLVISSNLWLGIWVYYNGREKRANQLFFLMSIFLCLWPFFGYLTYFSAEAGSAIFWGKLAYATVSVFIAIFYFFFQVFLEEEKRFRIFNFFVAIGSLFFLSLSIFTNYVVRDIKIEKWGAYPTFSYGTYFFYLFVFSIFLFIFFRFYKKYLTFQKENKLKIRYFFVGTLIFLLLNTIFNIAIPILTGTFELHQLGNYASIFLVGFTAYAIVKEELFDIKVVLTALFLGLMAILFLLDIFIPLSYSYIFKPIAFLIFLVLSRALVKHDIEEAERLKKTEKLAQDLENANKYLKDLMELKTNFIHIVSHQLRTPLTAVRGYLTMWDEGEFDSFSPRKMAEIKKRIITSADRLNNIVNGMVVAMESEGDLELKFQPVDVEEILKEAMGILKINYDKKDLYLRCKKEGEILPKIESDPKYLSNVFMNLIDNAEKYTKKGGLSIKIFREGNYIKLIFTDTGVGISKEDKEKLFEKFSRGINSSYINPNGSGLGLFIVKQVLEKHHGKIEVLSDGEGKGTTFAVILPIRQPASVGVSKPSLSGVRESSSNNNQQIGKSSEAQSYFMNKKDKGKIT